jgi:hypothetical protein
MARSLTEIGRAARTIFRSTHCRPRVGLTTNRSWKQENRAWGKILSQHVCDIGRQRTFNPLLTMPNDTIRPFKQP